MVCEFDHDGGLGCKLVCLNPCFDGIWSASEEEYDQLSNQASVLILVLMEYGLREG